MWQLDNAAHPSHADFKEIFLASLHIDPPIVQAIRRCLSRTGPLNRDSLRIAGSVCTVAGASINDESRIDRRT